MSPQFRRELLADVAQQFETLAQPLSLEWMQQRGVSLDELKALSSEIALVLRGFAALAPSHQIAFVTRGVLMSGPMMPPAANAPLIARQEQAGGN